MPDGDHTTAGLAVFGLYLEDKDRFGNSMYYKFSHLNLYEVVSVAKDDVQTQRCHAGGCYWKWHDNTSKLVAMRGEQKVYEDSFLRVGNTAYYVVKIRDPRVRLVIESGTVGYSGFSGYIYFRVAPFASYSGMPIHTKAGAINFLGVFRVCHETVMNKDFLYLEPGYDGISSRPYGETRATRGELFGDGPAIEANAKAFFLREFIKIQGDGYWKETAERDLQVLSVK